MSVFLRKIITVLLQFILTHLQYVTKVITELESTNKKCKYFSVKFFYIIHSLKITFYNHWVLHCFSFTLLCFDVPPSKKDVIILTFQFSVIQMMMLLRCFTSDILIRCSGYEMSTLHVGKLTDMSNNIVYIHDPEFNFDVRW